jgi:putative transposase
MRLLPSALMVDQFLVLNLQAGQIVNIDNLGRHKSPATKQAIRVTGERLWLLPPYSPDLNPIEQTFSKVKLWMGMAQNRSIETVQNELGKLITTITPNGPVPCIPIQGLFEGC